MSEEKLGKDMDLQERVRLKKADRRELYYILWSRRSPKPIFLLNCLMRAIMPVFFARTRR